MTGKTAIVGDGDSIMVFKAAGVAAFPAEDEKRRGKFCAGLPGSTKSSFSRRSLRRLWGTFSGVSTRSPIP